LKYDEFYEEVYDFEVKQLKEVIRQQEQEEESELSHHSEES